MSDEKIKLSPEEILFITQKKSISPDQVEFLKEYYSKVNNPTVDTQAWNKEIEEIKKTIKTEKDNFNKIEKPKSPHNFSFSILPAAEEKKPAVEFSFLSLMSKFFGPLMTFLTMASSKNAQNKTEGNQLGREPIEKGVTPRLKK
jgi:hypothetical protein